MALVLICAAAYLITTELLDITFETPNLVPQTDEFHMYSGIHPELYMAYLRYKNEGRYEDAWRSLEELALYADIEFRDEIYEKILKRQESLSK
jgi:hypothetical protein